MKTLYCGGCSVGLILHRFFKGLARGLVTRFFAAAAIAIVLAAFHSLPARSQGSDDSSSENQCFPWQELRNGQCVAKPATMPPPPSAPLTPAPQTSIPRASAPQTSIPQMSAPQAPDPCSGRATRNLSAPCICVAGTHLDAASGRCVADLVPPPAPALPRPPSIAIVCNGGMIVGGQCNCPAGFHLMASEENAGNGGTCIKTHADNCLGGELTVSGTCLCTGEVVMSGETYALEFENGKCLPRRCPEQTLLRGGKCIAISSTAAAPEPEETAKPASRAETPGEHGEEKNQHCARGMVRSRTGCVAAQHRYQTNTSGAQSDPRRYYRTYPMPGN
jgi:hypothetical protein